MDIKSLRVQRNNHKTNAILTGYFPISDYWTQSSNQLALKLNLIDRDITTLSLFIPQIKEMTAKGNVKASITGTLSDIKINSEPIQLRNLIVNFDPKHSMIESPFKIPKYDGSVIDNTLSFDNMNIYWKGNDTKTKTSRYPRENKLRINGNIGIQKLSLLSYQEIIIQSHLAIDSKRLFLNLKNIYNGELQTQNIRLIGDYPIPLSRKQKTIVAKEIGTEKERGPVLSGEFQLKNGSVFLPAIGKKKRKASYLLNLTASLQKNIVFEGSFLGTGVFNVANQFYIESHHQQRSALKITGSLNAADIKGDIRVGNHPNFIQRYNLSLSNQNHDERTVQEGFKLIMPQFLSNPDDSNVSRIGAQQANLWFRRNLRPIEKRVAKRAGLYDLRIDYNLGKTLESQFNNTNQSNDTLIGLNMMWNLMSEKLFMRLKTDVNLDNAEDEHSDNIKLTEFELSYFLSNNMTLNYSNITDFYEDRSFQPRLSLKLSYAF